MQDIIKLVEVAAWPMVALLGVVLLGPGGYLLKYAKALGDSLGSFNRSIPELKDTALTLRSDVEMLVATAKNVSSVFSDEYKGLEERIDALSKKLSDQLSEVREVLDDMDKSKIVESQEEIAKALDGPGAVVVEEMLEEQAAGLSADEMMESIKIEWDSLVETLKERLGNPEYFDKRQVGSMAWRLSHGKRLNPISKAAAELIADLHSQYKRFIRLTSSKDEWLTPDVHRNFLVGVRKASDDLRG